MKEKQPRIFNRRTFLKYASAGLITYFLGETGYFIERLAAAEKIVFKHQVIHSPFIDRQFFIVHLTDLHISGNGVDFVCPRTCDQLADHLTNNLISLGANTENTVVVNTGDLVSVPTGDGQETKLEDFRSALSCLNQIPARNHIITEGNHDVNHEQSAELWQIAQNLGYQVLGVPELEKFFLESAGTPFVFLGLPDFNSRKDWYDRGNLNVFSPFLQNNKDRPVILVTHNASIVDVFNDAQLEKTMKNVIVLAGHTHGGQINSPLSPIQHLASRYAFDRLDYKSRFIDGLSVLDSNLGNIVAVSPGVGCSHWHKVRTVPRQVSILEFRSTKYLNTV